MSHHTTRILHTRKSQCYNGRMMSHSITTRILHTRKKTAPGGSRPDAAGMYFNFNPSFCHHARIHIKKSAHTSFCFVRPTNSPNPQCTRTPPPPPHRSPHINLRCSSALFKHPHTSTRTTHPSLTTHQSTSGVQCPLQAPQALQGSLLAPPGRAGPHRHAPPAPRKCSIYTLHCVCAFGR